MGLKQEGAQKGTPACAEIGDRGPSSLFCRNPAALSLKLRGSGIGLSMRIKSCQCTRENEQERKQQAIHSLLIRCEIQCFLHPDMENENSARNAVEGDGNLKSL